MNHPPLRPRQSHSSIRARSLQALMPERVGEYDLLLPIASGGMATVYLARATGLGGFERPVALKLTHAHLLAETGDSGDLIEEAKLGARVRHANVVATLDVGEDVCGVYLVMEYVEGESLSGLLRRAVAVGAGVPVRIGVRILLDALAGLHAAHELTNEEGASLGVVHRDFSPQNILVGADGVARLTDFGVAKASSRSSQTTTGLVKGKIGYMAPEQARGRMTDRRCDVWAAGVVAWETLAGRRLFRAHNDVATLLQLVTQAPPRLRSSIPGVPEAIDRAVASALTPDVRLRCPSALDFAKQLRDGCAEAGLIATHDEVARFVQIHVGSKLEERRARAREVSALRARTAELRTGTCLGMDSTPSSGVLAGANVEPVAAAVRVLGEATLADEPTTDHVSSRPDLLKEQTGLTHTASIPDVPVSRSSRHKRILASIALTLMLAVCASFAALQNQDSAETPRLLAGLSPGVSVTHSVQPSRQESPTLQADAQVTDLPELKRTARIRPRTSVPRRPLPAPPAPSPIPRSPYR